MGHKILGDRFISRKEPAWHELGIVLPEDTELTARGAVEMVAGDVAIEARPIFYEDAGGVMCPLKGQRAIVRSPLKDSPESVCFGITSERWDTTHYPQLAEALDELAKAYRVETAGLLQDGSLCFLSLRGNDWDVLGDEMRTYFVANFSLEPGKAHKIIHTPVRVVCWNTNTLAEQQATLNLPVSHGIDAKQRIALAASLVARIKDVESKTKEIFERMASRSVSKEDIDKVFLASWPDPVVPPILRLLKERLSPEQEQVFRNQLDGQALDKMMTAEDNYEKQVSKVREVRATGLERFEAFEPDYLRGTAWALYQAVTEVSDWRDGRLAAESSLFGNRAKEKARAFSSVMAVTGMN